MSSNTSDTKTNDKATTEGSMVPPGLPVRPKPKEKDASESNTTDISTEATGASTFEKGKEDKATETTAPTPVSGWGHPKDRKKVARRVVWLSNPGSSKSKQHEEKEVV
jgi:hypothetical protein